MLRCGMGKWASVAPRCRGRRRRSARARRLCSAIPAARARGTRYSWSCRSPGAPASRARQVCERHACSHLARAHERHARARCRQGCARRDDEVWHVAILADDAKSAHGCLIAHDVAQEVWSVLLHPVCEPLVSATRVAARLRRGGVSVRDARAGVGAPRQVALRTAASELLLLCRGGGVRAAARSGHGHRYRFHGAWEGQGRREDALFEWRFPAGSPHADCSRFSRVTFRTFKKVSLFCCPTHLRWHFNMPIHMVNRAPSRVNLLGLVKCCPIRSSF